MWNRLTPWVALCLIACGTDETPAAGSSDTQTADVVDIVTDAAIDPTDTVDVAPADTGPLDIAQPDTFDAAQPDTADVAEPEDTAPQCTGTADCPGSDDPCKKASCQKGVCLVVARDEGAGCPHADECVLTAACKNDVCEPIKQVACDDNDPCTTDTCTVGICESKPGISDAPCDDGNPCTKGEKCAEKLGCSGGEKVCDCDTYEDCAVLDDANPCNGTLYCDKSGGPSDGKCLVDPASVITCSNATDGPCETTACDPKLAQCTTTPRDPGTPCEDGKSCTVDEACDALANCQAGKNNCDCEDDAGCLDQDDGNPCNGTLFCDKTNKGAFKCTTNPSTIKVCDPGKDTPCVANICGVDNGTCQMTAINLGGTCTDGDPCTAGDHCAAGKCAAGKDICSCKVDSDCAIKEDGNLCNGTLFCNKAANTCEHDPSTVVSCPTVDDTACLSTICTKKTGKCEPKTAGNGAECDDGNKCTTGDYCDQGKCSVSANTCECTTDSDCLAKDDGDKCNGVMFCNKVAGDCRVNEASVVKCPTVNDDACLANLCVPLTGECTMTAINQSGPCDADATDCTKGDRCEAGNCVSGTNICACKKDGDCQAQEDGNLCNGTLFCNKTTGGCEFNPATVLICPTVDDTTCQATVCAKKTGKCIPNTPINNGFACDDGNPCTYSDSCLAGKCQSGVVTCECGIDADCAKKEDDDACTGPLFCDKSGPHNVCKPNPAKTVTCALEKKKDGPCTRTECNPKTAVCEQKAVNDKAVCKEGTLCTTVYICLAGTCTKGKPLDCNDGNPCTVDTCDDFQGCKHAITNAVPCDDANFCTSDDVCVKGFCTGTSVDCDDGTPCTQDVCAPLSGCVYFARPGKCDDGDACTDGDVCADGACKSGDAVQCDDDNLCTADSCDSTIRCVHKPLQLDCDDGNACTLNDRCTSGICLPGKEDTCDDANDCTVDLCDEATGCLHDKTDDGSDCSDGDLCTESDSCVSGACSATPTVCDDDNTCTADSCDQKTGLCGFVAAKDATSCHDLGTCAGGNCVDANRGRVRIPAGAFSMGCNEDKDSLCVSVEKPQHTATLGAYWIDLAEASIADYRDCVVQGGCRTPTRNRNNGSRYNWGASAQDRLDHPINGITWDHAAAFCAWRAGRLPTEAQWEKAARGGCEKYPSGSCDALASVWPVPGAPTCSTIHMQEDQKDGCGAGITASVGSRALAGPYGLMDTAGNVAEWVSDFYNSFEYAVHATTDPTGPNGGSYRLYRGGAFRYSAAYQRLSRRWYAPAQSAYDFIGVRCAYDAPDCDDGNVCTQDKRDPATKACAHTPKDGARCYDGTGCTEDDTCAKSACVAGKALDCDDDNPCSTDACHVASGRCDHKAVKDATSCGHGAEVCASGRCYHQGTERVRVPASSVWIGCNATLESCASDEKPQTEVTTSAYWMDRFEVTKRDYRACVEAGACSKPALEGSTPCKSAAHAQNNWTQPDRDDHPMNCVTRTDAAAYCAWIGGVLPTEVQWEKAARGGCELVTSKDCEASMRPYPWGGSTVTCERGHFSIGGSGCKTGITSETGQHPTGASPYGVQNMGGNVSEWVADGYDSAAYAKWAADAEKSGLPHDPSTPLTGTGSSRGGNFLTNNGRAADRRFGSTAYRTEYTGIRCARPWSTCDDGRACTADSSDGKGGCVHQPLSKGPCRDNDYCTSGDTCDDGKCKAGPAKVCDDGDPCTVGDCDAKTGACSFAPGNDGTACSAGAVCDKGNCLDKLKDRVLIPGGVFYRGYNTALDNQWYNNERPQAKVTLSAYMLDRTEVTVEQYDACVKAGKCSHAYGHSTCTATVGGEARGANNYYRYNVGKDATRAKHPMNCLTFEQAEAVCAFKGGYLPTEAQWEMAARGSCGKHAGEVCSTAMLKYPWGGATPTCEIARMKDEVEGTGCGTGKTAPVGSFAGNASPYGLLDMAGNVLEWTADLYDAYPASTFEFTDPTGPKSTSTNRHVIRGGSLVNDARGLRASYRGSNYTGNSGGHAYQGVRCAYDGDSCDDKNPCTADFWDGAQAKCGTKPVVDGEGCDDGNACSEADQCKAGKCVGTKQVTCPDAGPCMAGVCDAKLGDCSYKPANEGKSCHAQSGSTCKTGACTSKDGRRKLIWEGPFAMGCNGKSCSSNAVPLRAVTLDSYWLDTTEVSVAAYRQCVAAGVCEAPYGGGSCLFIRTTGNWGHPDRDNHPVGCVTWVKADAYCQWVGGALPTEAQWEKAARGGCEYNAGDCLKATRDYPWGNAAVSCDYAHVPKNNAAGCGTYKTAAVGATKTDSSPYGVLDMAGNVREWTADWYSATAYKDTPDTDPTGPATGTTKAYRGGALHGAMISYARYDWPPTNNNYFIGIRCAYPFEPCDDDNPCTTDKTDAKTGACSHTDANGQVCTDDDPCHTGDKCQAGKCASGKTVKCSDGDPCTADLCDAKPGTCEFKLFADGTNCIGGGKCAAGICRTADESYIPPGPFWRGCDKALDKDCATSAQPKAQITIGGYWMRRLEATASDYRECVTAGGCSKPSGAYPATSNGYKFTYGGPDELHMALNGVTWPQAQAYCQWIGARLATEAEWEKAARGGCDRYPGKDCKAAMPLYPWGNKAPDCTLASMLDPTTKTIGCGKGAAFVGEHAAGASIYGIEDLAGGLYEWVADYHDTAYYAKSPSTDPTGPSSGSNRAYRGGGWYNDAYSLRSSYRKGGHPTAIATYGLGIRCVRSWHQCDDGELCTDDSYDSGTDKCVYKPVTRSCDDGNPCTDFGNCKSGKCTAGKARSCDDANSCTTDSCDAKTGDCKHTNKSAGSSCGGKWAGCQSGTCVGKTENMTLIPTDTFWMGCNAKVDGNCASNEKPAYSPKISAYYMDIDEVEQGDYLECVKAGACKSPQIGGYRCSPANKDWLWGQGKYDKMPIVCVSFDRAETYCKWRGKRLPTEAEWEMAARGGCSKHSGSCQDAMPRYPWGNQIATCTYAWMNDDSHSSGCGVNRVSAVGTRQNGNSPYGLHDMAGNAYEWVSDIYASGYYKNPDKTDPKGPPKPPFSLPYERIIRGGSWTNPWDHVRASRRVNIQADFFGTQVSFRCVTPR